MSKEFEKLEETLKEYADLLEDFEPTEENLKKGASMFDNVEIEEHKEPWYESLWVVIPLFPFYFLVQEIKMMKNRSKYHVGDAFDIWFQFLLWLGGWAAMYFGIAMLLYHIFTNLTVAIVCASIVVAVLIIFVLPIYFINKYITKNRDKI